MLEIQPIVRLLTAISLLMASFLATSNVSQISVYILVLVAVVATGEAGAHLRFMWSVGIVLLGALIVVWVIAMPLSHGDHAQGLWRALLPWIRIMSCAGIMQALFLPLFERPRHLQDFLTATRMNGAVGMVFITSILFIPEVKRRLLHIIDARKAQGYDLQGVAGLRELPRLLMPLVSSLLDSSAKRAELWSHRGLLHRYENNKQALDEVYKPFVTLLSALVAATAIGIGVLG